MEMTRTARRLLRLDECEDHVQRPSKALHFVEMYNLYTPGTHLLEGNLVGVSWTGEVQRFFLCQLKCNQRL